ncbi:hypothetical protein B0H14DRAFT_2600796 [Mycena olivaceomarginata]|nr:hypothetical protein B0H14DRAFT_2600796 [Mycena olivaceomarginata]
MSVMWQQPLIAPIRPFFTQSENFSVRDDGNLETNLKSQGEGDEAPDGEKTDPGKVWFIQPKYMPDWLYHHFPKVIQPMITQKEKGLLPSSSHIPAYHHPDYIPSQFLQREVAADFQNRSINPGPEMRYDAMLPIPPMVDPICNEPGFESVRPCAHAEVVRAPTVQGRVEYSTVKSSVQYHANTAGTSRGVWESTRGKNVLGIRIS